MTILRVVEGQGLLSRTAACCRRNCICSQFCEMFWQCGISARKNGGVSKKKKKVITRASFCNFCNFFYSFRRLPKYSKLMYFNDLSCLQEFYFETFCNFFCFTRNFLLQLLSIFAQNVKVWFKKTCCKLFQFCPILFNCITTSCVTD